MAWDGYWEFDGTEVLNVARVEAYARHLPWFKPLFKNPHLGPMLGHKPYRTPALDDAPWTDPDVPESYEFFGCYPLSIEGAESSTRTATITESTGDGGVVGATRFGTKQIPFNVLLVAETEAGAEYGMRWLRRTLDGAACSPLGSCAGGSLCFLSSEPVMSWLPTDLPEGSQYAVLDGGDAELISGLPFLDGGKADTVADLSFEGGDASNRGPLLTRSTSIFVVDTENQTDPGDCLTPYMRTYRKVGIPDGPKVTSKRNLRRGGAVWTASFVAVAGSPFEVGPELEVIRGFLDPDIASPWVSDTLPPDASIDLDGYLMSDESSCYPPLVTPLYDPLNPVILLPPSTPSVPLGHFDPPLNWQRRQFTIPKQYIPLWGDMVPLVRIHARHAELRNLRLRFYADPYNVGDISDDPCAFCGDIIVSYIPEGYSMTIDGVEEIVTVTSAGGLTQRADSLLFASDGTPFTWPKLSCGFGYVVTLDLPQTAPTPVVDVSLFERVQ